jgi:hypothetical protein
MRRLTHRLVIASLLAIAAYAPAVNNGFIADDYVILQRIGFMKAEPLYLLHVPPENFRFVSYLVFAFCKMIAGYDARLFYAVNIALHVANIALLRHLLMLVTGDDFVADTAALLFAVFQAPQEAVMWLAAMNETTLAFFTFVALIMWWRNRYFLAAVAYSLALFSKESGIIVLLATALWELKQRQWKPFRAYAFLLIPTAIFSAVFFSTLSRNFMVANRFYALGPHAILVLLLSLHRLIWPWFYILLFLVWLGSRERGLKPANTIDSPVVAGFSPRSIPLYLACVLLAMLPYMFITYQNSLQSRQLYLASAVLMTVFALLLKRLRGTLCLPLFIAAFIAFNVSYLWVRKDAQFEDRAAPTTQLVDALRAHMPQPTVVLNFAYPYPAIAQAAALAVPGWAPELIRVGESSTQCAGCLTLRWNPGIKRYE